MSSGPAAPARRLVITVCPLEPGSVAIPVERGGRVRRMNAGAIATALGALIAARKLGGIVELRAGCAGGCGRSGPNVSVTIYPVPQPGEKPDRVAIGWKTYVYSLASLDCLARVIEENLGRRPRSAPEAPRATPRSAARRRR